jgi:hypothetical protein
MCMEIWSEANTSHAFEFTAALSDLQDFVPARVRSLFHKFNHSTPCATNATLPLSPRNDGFRIIYWIAPAIQKTFLSHEDIRCKTVPNKLHFENIEKFSRKRGRI